MRSCVDMIWRRAFLVAALQTSVAVAWSVGGAASATTESTTSVQRLERSPTSLRGKLDGRAQAPSSSNGIETGDPIWFRSLLAAVAMIAVVVAGGPRSAHAEANVDVYFGQGCFWHVQHEAIMKEMNDLGRKPDQVTALAGYAGGTKIGANGEVCYHNMAMAPDYGQMGHTEVVNVKVPESKVADFAKLYIDAAEKYPGGRADPQDRGGEYRSAIGLPGGMEGALFKEVQQVNAGRIEFVQGSGNDEDTVGTKKVWVYDTKTFPFYQGEVYHQFHNDMREGYSDEYKKTKDVVLKEGTLKTVSCPEFGF